MTSMIALQSFGGRTFRPFPVKYNPTTEGLTGEIEYEGNRPGNH